MRSVFVLSIHELIWAKFGEMAPHDPIGPAVIVLSQNIPSLPGHYNNKTGFITSYSWAQHLPSPSFFFWLPTYL